MSNNYFQGFQERLQKVASTALNASSNAYRQSITGQEGASKSITGQEGYQVDLLTGNTPNDIIPIGTQPLVPTSVNISRETQDTGSLLQEVDRLKKFETKFVGLDMLIKDLAKAYKAIKSKHLQLEQLIVKNTPITSLSMPNHFTDLEAYLKLAQANQESGSEVNKLAQQITALKNQKDEEATAHAEMYGSVQLRLVEREEEINRLKRRLWKLEGLGTPVDGALTPSSEVSNDAEITSLKLKVKDLNAALQKVTYERDQVSEKLKHGLKHSESAPALNISTDSIQSFSNDRAHLDEIESLRNALEQERNSSSALAELTKSQSKNIEELEKQIESLKAARDRFGTNISTIEEGYSSKVKDLEGQVQSLFEDLSEMSTQNEKLKSEYDKLSASNKLLLSGNSGNALEQVRQEARERHAGLEFRLGTLQQKLENAEKEKQETLAKLKAATDKLEAVRQKPLSPTKQLNPIPLVDPQEMLALKDSIKKLENEKQTLQEELNKHTSLVKVMKTQAETLENEKKAIIRDLELKNTRLQAMVDKKNRDVAELQKERDLLKFELAEEKESREKQAADDSSLQTLELKLAGLDEELTLKQKKIDELEQSSSINAEKLSKERQLFEDSLNSKIRELKEKNSTSQKRIIELETEVEKMTALKRQQQDSESIRKDLEIELYDLRGANKSVKEEFAKTVQELSKLKSLIQETREEAIKRNTETAAMTEEIKSLKEEVSSTKASSSAQIAKFLERIKKQVSEINELKKSEEALKALQIEYEKISNQLKKAALKLKELNVSPNEIDQVVVDESGHDVNTEAELKILQNSLEECKNALNNTKASLDDMNQKYSDLEITLEASELAKSNLEEECKVLTAKLNNHKSEMDKSITAIKNLQAKNKEKDDLIDQIKKELENNVQKSKEYEADIEKARHNLETKEKNWQEKLNLLEVDLAAARKSCSEYKSNLHQIQTQLEQVEEEKSNLVKLADMRQQQLEELKNKSISLENEISILKSSGKDSEKVAALKEELMKLKKENIQIASQKETIESLTFDLKMKDDTIKEMSQATDLLRTKVSESESKILKLNQERKELDEKIESLNETKNNLELTLKQLENENNQLRTQNAEQKTDSAEALELQAKIEKLELAVKDREAGLAEMSGQLAKVKQQLTEEEEKKSKSIQLLRVSKNRIIKLEGEVGQQAEQIKAANEKLEASKKAAEKSQSEKDTIISEQKKVTESLVLCQGQVKELEFSLATLRKQLSEERDQVKKLSLQIQEKDERLAVLMARVEDFNGNYQQEVEVLRNQCETLKKNALEADEKVKDYDYRIENLEQDLETSKRLFQTKSIENDQLKLRISELESNIYETSQEIGKHADSLQEFKRSAVESKREIQEKIKEIKVLSKELADAKSLANESCQVIEKQKQEIEQLKSRFNTLELSLAELVEKEQVAQLEAITAKANATELEEKMNTILAEKVKWIQEKDTLLSDFRMREAQLKNLNKTLKDEVRKFRGTPTSSAEPSPVLSRASTARKLNHESPPPVPPRTFGRNSTEDLPELNTEYLKAVILKFLEGKKDTRVQLISVIAMLLKFSPDETLRIQKSV